MCHVSQSSDGLCPSMEKPYKKVAEKLWSPILLDLYSGTRFLIIGGQRNTHNIFLYNMWHIKLVMSAKCVEKIVMPLNVELLLEYMVLSSSVKVAKEYTIHIVG